MDQGLQVPTLSAPPALIPYVGGVAMEGLSSIEAREQARQAAEATNNKPLIQGLAGFVRECFDAARSSRKKKLKTVCWLTCGRAVVSMTRIP